MNINLSKQAVKFLDSQEDKIVIRVLSAINKLPSGNTKKLKGYDPPIYRLSVGSFRILYNMERDNIKVKKIDNRGQAYKN